MKEQVKELRELGYSQREIASQLNITCYKAQKILLELGLNKQVKNNTGGALRKYPINHNLFRTIDTQEKAYFLGLLYADGCIRANNVYICLKADDRKLLEDIKLKLNIQNPLYEFQSRYSVNHRYTDKVSLTFSSNQIIYDLYNLGCVPRKSDILIFPTVEQVPKHLQRHFIRGYFDGDGSVYTARKIYLTASFMSTYEFCNSVLELLPCKQNLKIRKEKRSLKNVWQFEIGSKEDINKLYDFMYKDATIFLERKYKRFKDYLNREPK